MSIRARHLFHRNRPLPASKEFNFLNCSYLHIQIICTVLNYSNGKKKSILKAKVKNNSSQYGLAFCNIHVTSSSTDIRLPYQHLMFSFILFHHCKHPILATNHYKDSTPSSLHVYLVTQTQDSSCRRRPVYLPGTPAPTSCRTGGQAVAELSQGTARNPQVIKSNRCC